MHKSSLKDWIGPVKERIEPYNTSFKYTDWCRLLLMKIAINLGIPFDELFRGGNCA